MGRCIPGLHFGETLASFLCAFEMQILYPVLSGIWEPLFEVQTWRDVPHQNKKKLFENRTKKILSRL